MIIEYLGHSCFKLINQNNIVFVTDPYTKVGYEMPKIKADIVTCSHGHFDHCYLDGVDCEDVIRTVGEYTVFETKIISKTSFHDPKQGTLRGINTIFTLNIDGMSVCHLGDLGESCSQELLEKIGHPDILLLPIGGTYTIDAKQAKEYVDAVQPKIVIPMHYRPKDGALDIATEEEFLQLCKNYPVRVCSEGKIEIQKQELQDQNTQIIFMERIKEK